MHRWTKELSGDSLVPVETFQAMPGSNCRFLKSSIDSSANFIRDTSDGGCFEARYVRRAHDYVIVYLSSHSGCRQGCRFCHLTATGQTTMLPATLGDFLQQADDVLAYYDSVSEVEGRAARVHFNWMARGEALANPCVLSNFNRLTQCLATRAADRGLLPIFNISTILPTSFSENTLETVLQCSAGEVVVYYSLYSLNEKFRRKWLPTALPAEEALVRLAAYQRATGRRIVLHWAYIRDENDSREEALKIADTIGRHALKAKFNLVRYNAFSEKQGSEATEESLAGNFEIIAGALANRESRIIERVGYDVKASCGMFVETRPIK